MKTITTYFSLAFLLSASTLSCMQNHASSLTDTITFASTTSKSIALPSDLDSDSDSDKETALLAKKKAFMQKTNAEIQQDINRILPSADEKKNKEELFEPLNQICALIVHFQEYQNNPDLNIPENTSLASVMLTSMQTLLDKAKTNYKVSGGQHSPSVIASSSSSKPKIDF